MEAEVRDTPTAEDLLAGVREGVEEIVREALEEAASLREQADEKLQRYDGITSELAALRLEKHALKHDLADLPARVHVAALDSLAVSYVGEAPDLLQRRYVTARERLPVVEDRLSRLEDDLSRITSGGSRPAKVSPEGGQRRLLKHESREPALDVLNETVNALERLRNQLPDVVKDVAADLQRERDTLRSGQNNLWGLAKAPK
jgi:chromosome segregation ATPase